MGNADNVLFDNDSRVAPLGLIAMAGASELGKKVDGYLTKWANENEFVKDTFLVEAVCPRFSSGDGKGLIKSSILTDAFFYKHCHRLLGQKCKHFTEKRAVFIGFLLFSEKGNCTHIRLAKSAYHTQER